MVKLAPPGGDDRGLYGDEHGLYLGPDVALIARNPADPTGFAVRPQAELERLLGAGYGTDVNLINRMAGLQAVSRALAKGAVARALICASYLRLPPLPDAAGAARIKAVDRLLKYAGKVGQKAAVFQVVQQALGDAAGRAAVGVEAGASAWPRCRWMDRWDRGCLRPIKRWLMADTARSFVKSLEIIDHVVITEMKQGE